MSKSGLEHSLKAWASIDVDLTYVLLGCIIRGFRHFFRVPLLRHGDSLFFLIPLRGPRRDGRYISEEGGIHRSMT
jgi:hypothetical protein